MEKVIKQEREKDLIIWVLDKEIVIFNVNTESSYIEKSKAREVALAIYPELESELKEAVELIENAGFLIHATTFDYPNICELMKKDIESFSNKSKAFLTKHKKH